MLSTHMKTIKGEIVKEKKKLKWKSIVQPVKGFAIKPDNPSSIHRTEQTGERRKLIPQN